jgi:outer membrane receptor for monomeric catechols
VVLDATVAYRLSSEIEALLIVTNINDARYHATPGDTGEARCRPGPVGEMDGVIAPG